MAVTSSTTVVSSSQNTVFGSIAYFESIVQVRVQNIQGHNSNSSNLRESLIIEALSFLDQDDLEEEKRTKESEIIDYVVTKFKINILTDMDSDTLELYENKLSKLKGYLKNIYSIDDTFSSSSNSSSGGTTSTFSGSAKSGIYANQEEEESDTWKY